MVDGAAFQHEVEAANGRRGEARDVVADGRVVGKVVFAAPAVGREAQGDLAAGGRGENRTCVAKPDIAVTSRDELGAPLSAARADCSASSPFTSSRTVLLSLKRAHHRRHVAAGRFEVAVPLVGVGRPCRPDRLLWRPFSRDQRRRVVHEKSPWLQGPVLARALLQQRDDTRSNSRRHHASSPQSLCREQGDFALPNREKDAQSRVSSDQD